MNNHSLQPLTKTPSKNVSEAIPSMEESDTMKSIFLAAYVIVAVAGLFGNMITCYAIARHRHLRKAVHWYTFNMAIADLLVILFYVPVEVIKNENNMKWTMGEPLCRINYCVIPTSLVASIYTLIAITVDRHRGITKPLRWRSDSGSFVKFSIPIIWLIAIVLSMPLMVVVVAREFPTGSGVYFCYEQWSTVRSERAYWTTMFCVQVLVPMWIVISLNLHMFKVLKRYSRRDKGYHKKIIKMTVALVLVYIVCSSPQHIFFFWHSFGDSSVLTIKFQKVLFKTTNLLLIVQMALNPVIYGTLGDLKRSFKTIFHRIKCHLMKGFRRKESHDGATSQVVIAERDPLNSPDDHHL